MNILTEQALGNLANGGRGIGNVVENLLINPLSRYLFDNEIFDNATVRINNIDVTELLSLSFECPAYENMATTLSGISSHDGITQSQSDCKAGKRNKPDLRFGY